MDNNVLAELVAGAVKKEGKVSLGDEEKHRFYREFGSGVYREVEKIRSAKKRAYEEMKNIAIG